MNLTNQANFVDIPFLKRVFDVSMSLAAILILSPLSFVFFLLLFIEQIFSPSARGPLFYCETRVSGGEPFKLCKIRVCRQSAYEEAKANHGFIHTAEVEEKRENFLKTGWLLKKIYMDEFPQLFNVLKGEMSLVGPRPANLENYRKLVERGERAKSSIKAGLTGPFQSAKGNFPNADFVMDQEYVDFCRTHSAWQIAWYDFKVLLRTVRVVAEHKGI